MMWTMCINLISNYILPGWDKYYTNYDWSWLIILLLFTFFIGAEFKLTLHVYIKICPGWLMLSPGLGRTGDGPISSCCGITDDGQTFRQINNCAFSTERTSGSWTESWFLILICAEPVMEKSTSKSNPLTDDDVDGSSSIEGRRLVMIRK